MTSNPSIDRSSHNSGLNFSCESTMNSVEIEYLQYRLSKTRNYLEFGAGFSTFEATRLVRGSIVSVETNKDYIDFMSTNLSDMGIENSRVTFLHADIGPTGDWGHPINELAIKNWPRYANLQLIKQSFNNRDPDLVLVDGRFRVATFLKLYLAFPGIEIIFDDYFDRPQYHVVEKVITPKKQCGRIATFHVPRRRNRARCQIAIEILSTQILNPE